MRIREEAPPMRNPRRTARGFALAEFLIIVAILGLLSAVALPKFASQHARQEADEMQRGLTQLRHAVNVYWAQHDGFPGPQAADVERQLGQATDRAGHTGEGAAFDLGPYLAGGRLPTNPATGRCDLRIVQAMPGSPTGASGWLYCPVTGEVRADVPGRNADGVAWYDL
jgi:type II secretory pathway pseudopilin PulG